MLVKAQEIINYIPLPRLPNSSRHQRRVGLKKMNLNKSFDFRMIFAVFGALLKEQLCLRRRELPSPFSHVVCSFYQTLPKLSTEISYRQTPTALNSPPCILAQISVTQYII